MWKKTNKDNQNILPILGYLFFCQHNKEIGVTLTRPLRSIILIYNPVGNSLITMKLTKVTLLMIVVYSISVGFTVIADNMFAGAQETGNGIISSFNSTNGDGNVTIGKLIYEGHGEINSQTVLQGPTVQTSFSSNDAIHTGINNQTVMEIGTYTSTPKANGVLYGEGKGVMTGQNNEMVTWTSQQIGNMTPGKIVFHGSMFFNSLSPVGSLSFLDNMPGVFTFEVDASKNTITKVWELR